MTYDDIVSTLSNLDMLIKDGTGKYMIRCNIELVDEYLSKIEAKNYPIIKPNCLRWSPFLASKKDIY